MSEPRNENSKPKRKSDMTTAIFRLKGSFLAATALAFGFTFNFSARASEPFLSNAEVQALTGKSIAQWGAEWWQWAFKNPEVLFDKTGKSGRLGDATANVFFAEGSGGRPVNLKYTVPGNKYILVPVITYIWTFFAPCAEAGCATEIINNNVLAGVTDPYLIVDGVPLLAFSSHLVLVSDDTLPFQVDAGPIGPDGYGGILDALQGGYWVMLRPLSRGSHRISFGATAPLVDGATGQPVSGTVDLTTKLRLDVTNPN
jgi:hypothetical protein